MGPWTTTGTGRPGRLLIPIALLIAVTVMAMMVTAQEDPDRPEHAPIWLDGNEELDQFFAGDGTDGLSPATAHVLEGRSILRTGDQGDGIRLTNTTRHLVIRNVTVTDPVLGTDATAIQLIASSNVTITDCDLPGSRRAIVAFECTDLIISGNRVTNQSYMGIMVERSSHALVHGNRLETCNESVVVYRSDNVTVEANVVENCKVGIRMTASLDCFVYEGEVAHATDGAIKVQRSRGTIIVSGNHLHDNLLAGVYVSNSEGVEVQANMVYTSHQGIYMYDAEGCLVENNNVTDCDLVGIRLVDSHGNRIVDNDVLSNWAYGIDLSSSDSNTIKGNRVVSHEVGIRLVRSTDNVVEGNRLYSNWWAALDGDLDGNAIGDNDLRANGWAKGIIFLIVGLVVVGTAYGTFNWYRRRRRAKEEKGSIRIKRRFPSGAKALWPMSRVMWDEDFFKAQLATAGPQREEILRRYQQNIAAAKQMQYFAVGTMSVMLAFMAVLPLTSLLNIITIDVDSSNVNDVLFASAVGVSVYYLMTLVILMVFGLLFTAQMMRGEIFRLLATLPVERGHSRRLVLYLLFRMYGAPMVVVLLAFPIGGLLLTWSPVFFFTALAVNGLYLAFVSYLLIIIAEATSRRVFTASASKAATAMRFLIMAGYLVAMMMLFATLQYFVVYISGLFDAAKEAGGSGQLVNMVTSTVPFPFSGSYLISQTLVPLGEIPLAVMATTVVGMALMVLGVLAVRRRANRMLNRVASGSEVQSGGPGQVTTAADIVVSTRPIMPAFMRNGLLVTSRDQGAVLYIIMPLLFPLIAIVPMASETGQMSTFDAVMPFLMYMGIMPFLVNMALSSADANVGGLLGSLPFRVISQFRAKWSIIVLITSVPVAVIALAMFSRVDEPVEMIAILVSLVPLLMVMAYLYLVTFSLSFGTVNGKQTFFMANIRRKLAKYVGIIALQYTLVILELATFYALTIIGLITFWTGIAGLWLVNLSLLALLEVAARRVFS